MNYWLGYFLILFVGTGGLIALLLRLIRTKPPKTLLQGVILIILSLFLTFMGLEFFFKVFFARADSVPTLAQSNFVEWYHPPETINSIGYHDHEWTAEQVTGKTKVMVVGDSFVEALSLKNLQDRFSEVLAQKLGQDYVVFNVGKSGANTKEEIEAITTYPYRPDILIFSYFINDIEGEAAWQRGLERPPRQEVSPYLAPLVKNSYAFNFFYWGMARFSWFQPAGLEADAKSQWYFSLYNNPEVWWLHQQQLLSLYEGAKTEHIPLFVVVFPSLTYLQESKVATDRVVALFKERDVPTIDVGELVKDVPSSQLVASPVDSHPGELTHKLVAEALYAELMQAGLAKQTLR